MLANGANVGAHQLSRGVAICCMLVKGIVVEAESVFHQRFFAVASQQKK